MEQQEQIKKEQELLNKMNAFYYYKTKGMEYVQDNFPEEIDFVNNNRGKTYDEVKAELLKKIPTAEG